HERVEPVPLHGLTHPGDTVLHAVGLIARGTQDRAAARQQASAVIAGQAAGVVLDDPPPRVVEPDHRATVLDLDGPHCGPDDRVEPWAVASTSENPDAHAGTLPTWVC